MADPPLDFYANQNSAAFHFRLRQHNVAIDKLRSNEVYFSGKVPIFKEYRSMWNRAFDVQRESVGLDKVQEELAIATDFIEYVMSCLDDRVRPNVELVISRFELGLHAKDDRVGVLFAEQLVDFRPGPAVGSV